VRIMLVSKWIPFPPQSGDARRTLGMLRGLRELGDVVACGFVDGTQDVEGFRREGFSAGPVRMRRTPLRTLDGLLQTRSLSAARFWDRRLRRTVRDAARTAVDVLVVGHAQLRPLAAGTRPAVTVVDMQNIESVLADRVASTKRGFWRAVYRLEAALLRRIERATVSADIVSVVSEADRRALAEIVDHPHVIVVPNAWDRVTPLDPPAEGRVVSFVALLGWTPNVDAAVWLAERVWPLVTASVPDAELRFVGREPAEAVRRLAGPGVVVTGTVDSLEPWYRETSVTVAPLLAGGGSRLKILESLAHGRANVATTLGAEGLEDLVGRGVVVADAPADFAAALVDLLTDRERAADLGRDGAAAVESDHSWAHALEPLVQEIVRRREVA
jgi:polysaccharide biosynthesis protein PslH